MNLREIFLMAKEMEFDRVAVISETKGNPSAMEIYLEGKPLTSLYLTSDISLPKGRMNKNQILLRCDLEEFKDLAMTIFDMPLETKGKSYKKLPQNLLWIKRAENRKSKVLMEFYDSNSQLTSPRIYLNNWKVTRDENEGNKTS